MNDRNYWLKVLENLCTPSTGGSYFISFSYPDEHKPSVEDMPEPDSHENNEIKRDYIVIKMKPGCSVPDNSGRETDVIASHAWEFDEDSWVDYDSLLVGDDEDLNIDRTEVSSVRRIKGITSQFFYDWPAVFVVK